jgi:hypothetical protein
MSEQTNFTEVTAEKFTGDLIGNVTGNVTGDVTGSLIGTLSASAEISKADSYALVAADKVTPIIVAKMTAGSKVLTLGLAANKAVIVYNSGSESYTVKNVAADTGTVLATTKAILVVGSATANASIVVALN